MVLRAGYKESTKCLASGKKKQNRSQRRGHRQYISNLIQNANDVFQGYDSTQEMKFKQLEKSIEDRSRIIKQIDEEILDAIQEENEIIKEIEEAGKFNEGVDEILVRIGAKMAAKQHEVSHSQGNSSNSSNISSQGTKLSTRLPKLAIRKFAGDPIYFQTLWDNFRSAIHENESLSELTNSTIYELSWKETLSVQSLVYH